MLRLEDIYTLDGTQLWDGGYLPDRRTIVAGCDLGLLCVNLDDWEKSAIFGGERDSSQLVAGLGGALFASAERREHLVRIYDLDKGAGVFEIGDFAGEDFGVYGLAALEGGRLACVGSRETAGVWRIDSMGRANPETIFDTGFSSNYAAALDANALLVGGDDGAATRLDLKTGEQVWRKTLLDGVIVDFTVRGDRVGVAGTDGRALILNAATGETTTSYMGHQRDVNCIAWLDDETMLSIDDADEWRVWRADSGETLWESPRAAGLQALRILDLGGDRFAALGRIRRDVVDDEEVGPRRSMIQVFTRDAAAEKLNYKTATEHDLDPLVEKARQG